MKTIQILEPDDTFNMNDWCRPLYLNRDFSGDNNVYTKSLYSGSPQDNLKWVKVHKVFGECWEGRPIKEYFDMSPVTPGLVNYEFVRGDLPKEHLL